MVECERHLNMVIPHGIFVKKKIICRNVDFEKWNECKLYLKVSCTQFVTKLIEAVVGEGGQRKYLGYTDHI